MATHLFVLGNEGSSSVHGNAGLFNPNRYNFRWNKDATAFEPILAPYFDDASYIADQSRDYGAEVEQPIDEVQEPEFFPRDNVEKMPTENMWF